MNEKKIEELVLSKDKKALVIVAHPDDEVIWMGGLIMRYKSLTWTIFSLCRKSDKDREPKFKKVCKKLGVKCIIEDVEDESIMTLKESVIEIKKIILKKIKNKQFDYCFTHNRNGEYGHIRHKGVYLAVKELIDEGVLLAKEIFYFNYKKINRKVLPMIPKKDCSHIVSLTEGEYAKKREIVAEMYGYPYTGIDVNLCTKVEAFVKE